MSWQDRLRQAAYTSPSGIRIVFNYENVSRKIGKKTSAFEFPDANGTFVQDLGNTGRRYPIRAIFWGDNYDIEADLFESALTEKGIGQLAHPIYGTVNVIPFGTITRRDDLKTAANQAFIQVTFWETIELVFPESQSDPAAVVISAVDGYNTEASEQFAENIETTTVAGKLNLKNSYLKILDDTKDGLDKIASAKDDVNNQLNNIFDSINNGIDILIDQPLTLALQTVLMIQSAARSIIDIGSRLDAYAELISSLIFNDDTIDSIADIRTRNDFYNDDLYVSTFITGSIISAINNQFETGNNALEAADAILDQFKQISEWREDSIKALSIIDTGETYQKLQLAVAATVGFLIQISFTLKQERIIIIDRDRTIIDLVAELLGETDSALDFFINSNNLSGSEILELPKGRSLVYYI